MTSRPGVAVAVAIILVLGVTWLGLAVGFFTPYPVGFFITTFAFGSYVLVRGGHWLFGWRGRHRRLWESRRHRGETI